MWQRSANAAEAFWRRYLVQKHTSVLNSGSLANHLVGMILLYYLLEVKVNDHIIQEVPAVKAAQVLHCDGYSSFQRRRGKLDQPEQRWRKEE